VVNIINLKAFNLLCNYYLLEGKKRGRDKKGEKMYSKKSVGLIAVLVIAFLCANVGIGIERVEAAPNENLGDDLFDPVIVSVKQSNDSPGQGEDVTITAHVTDIVGVTSSPCPGESFDCLTLTITGSNKSSPRFSLGAASTRSIPIPTFAHKNAITNTAIKPTLFFEYIFSPFLSLPLFFPSKR